MLTAAGNTAEVDRYINGAGFDTRWRESWWRPDFLALLGRRLDFSDVNSMLDVGCGAGHWGLPLSRAMPDGVFLAGVDRELAFIDRAIASARDAGAANFEYKTGDAYSLPYDNDRFDLVTSQTLLIHIKDPADVIAEMRRVLRPGGLLLLAEPNNLMGYFSRLQSSPRPAWPVVLEQMDFYAVCLRGKQALGGGDAAIGDRLPALLANLGFTDIALFQNENFPLLVPPYASDEEQLEIAFIQRFRNDVSWLGFGDADETRALFIAGGGDAHVFPHLLDQAITLQNELFAALDAGVFTGSRGSALYVTAGRKPHDTAKSD